MTMSAPRVLGYAVSALSTVTGIVFLAGFALPESLPSHFRIMTAVVLILLGIYRFTVTRFRAIQQKHE